MHTHRHRHRRNRRRRRPERLLSQSSFSIFQSEIIRFLKRNLAVGVGEDSGGEVKLQNERGREQRRKIER